MTFNQFSNTPNILKKLLVGLGIFSTKKLIIKIDNTPDYDISKYEREEEKDYYFNNFWDFSDYNQSVVDLSFIEERLFHYDDFERGRDEYNIDFDEANPIQFLNNIYLLDDKWLIENGMEPDIDQFKLHELRVSSIDNTKKRLYYEGSFFGNYETFDPLDWGIYSLIEITGMPMGATKFYKDLIGESYVLHKENKNKLSYFLAYSAFESFITLELGHIDDERRLKEKLTELYRQKFPSLERHQIYTSIMSFYDSFTNSRNTIAHGINNITVTNEDANAAFLFITIMISTFEYNCTTFDELSQLI
jgi:hypothetical protein